MPETPTLGYDPNHIRKARHRSMVDNATGRLPTPSSQVSTPSRGARDGAGSPYGVDPPRPAKDGFEWVWFPDGYWAERPVHEKTESRKGSESRLWRWYSRSSRGKADSDEQKGGTTSASPKTPFKLSPNQVFVPPPPSPYLTEEAHVASLQHPPPSKIRPTSVGSDPEVPSSHYFSSKDDLEPESGPMRELSTSTRRKLFRAARKRMGGKFSKSKEVRLAESSKDLRAALLTMCFLRNCLRKSKSSPGIGAMIKSRRVAATTRTPAIPSMQLGAILHRSLEGGRELYRARIATPPRRELPGCSGRLLGTRGNRLFR